MLYLAFMLLLPHIVSTMLWVTLNFHLLCWRVLVPSTHLLILMTLVCLKTSVIECINSCTCSTLYFSCCSSDSLRLCRHQSFCSLVNVIESLIYWTICKLLLILIYNLVIHIVLIKWIFKSGWNLGSNHIWWGVIPQLVCCTHTIVTLSYIINILICLLDMLSGIIVSFLGYLLGCIDCIGRRLRFLMLWFLHHLCKLITLLCTLLMFISHWPIVAVVLSMDRCRTILDLSLLLLYLLARLIYLFHINLRFLHVTT